MLPNLPFIRLNQNLLYLLCAVALLSSCITTKKSVYFNDIPLDAKGAGVIPAEFKEPVICPDDILSITIQTLDPQVATVINQSLSAAGTGTAINGMQQIINGYLVDRYGNVELPMLGKVKVAGLTTFDAREMIRGKARQFFKDPTVQVRFANFKISVLGEVARPSTYIVANEMVSILDAISLAGDLTIYGKRENVLLVREVNGTKEFVRLNLNSSEIFKSPYFYLKQNDLVYVEPSKAKVANTNVARAQTISLIGTAFSVLIVLFSRISLN